MELVTPLAASSVTRTVKPDGPPRNWHEIMNQSRSTSNTIRVTCWVVVVASVACAIVFAVVLSVHSSLVWERRVLLMTVVAVVLISIQLILWVSRNEPTNIIIFTMVAAIVTGLCMGQTICYV